MVDKYTLDGLAQKVAEHKKNILELSHKTGKMHLGGDFSCAEILVTLFQRTLRIDPANPDWDDRDRFILSKGHGGGAMYLAMAQRGFFTYDEIFSTYRTGFETRFGMHPCKAACSMLDSSSGSLGHGLPIASGLALAGKMDHKDYRVFCLAGDGELDEGSNWEAMLAAAKYKLGNLIVIIDRNRLSLDGATKEILPLEPLGDKLRAFNWDVRTIEDGNDLAQVVNALDDLPPASSDVPTVIIARTVKGKGISFMENNALFHNAGLSDEQYQQALSDLGLAYSK